MKREKGQKKSAIIPYSRIIEDIDAKKKIIKYYVEIK